MPTANERSRGYYKIKGAADAFNFDFRGKTVLDIGSSTGGFTQYALDRGAKKIIAVEKGTNQMTSPLRHDHRIDLHEKTDIFDVKLGTLVSDNKLLSEENKEVAPINTVWAGDVVEGGPPREPSGGRDDGRTRPEESRISGLGGSRAQVLATTSPDVILADVSFISLKDVLGHARAHLADSHTDFLVMLKPQFEATPDQLNKGIVKNEKIRREIIKNFEKWLKYNGFVIIKKHDNSLQGKHGNQERFFYLKLAK